MLLCNTDEDLEKEAAYLRLLRMRRVDGLVVAPSTSAANGPWTARLDIPIVFVDRTVHGVNVDAVLVDNVGGMREAIKYLAGLGHRRIGLITGRPGVYTSEQRFRGYREALGELGLAFDPGLVRTGGFRLEGGQSAAAELLACPAPPTAIFASNNLMAIGAMRALAEAGLRCPDDVSIACFDDFEWASVFRPRLTTSARLPSPAPTCSSAIPRVSSLSTPRW